MQYNLARLSSIAVAATILAQVAGAQNVAAFGTCSPRGKKPSGSLGCLIIVEQSVGKLGARPVFWHISRFPSREAAMKARPPHGTVIDAFDSVWLMNVAGRRWRASGGKDVATIGPLPIKAGTAYSALYMEATMRPGMKSAIHRHSGPEAWYTLSGQTCLETPNGTSTGGAGGPPVIIPGNLPMELTATGKELRRSLVLILHDSRKPPTTMEHQWAPRGECK
jgi:quercetin dioxygenase-like cupin family protein